MTRAMTRAMTQAMTMFLTLTHAVTHAVTPNKTLTITPVVVRSTVLCTATPLPTAMVRGLHETELHQPLTLHHQH